MPRDSGYAGTVGAGEGKHGATPFDNSAENARREEGQETADTSPPAFGTRSAPVDSEGPSHTTLSASGKRGGTDNSDNPADYSRP